jgi:hypothetical protein
MWDFNLSKITQLLTESESSLLIRIAHQLPLLLARKIYIHPSTIHNKNPVSQFAKETTRIHNIKWMS